LEIPPQGPLCGRLTCVRLAQKRCNVVGLGAGSVTVRDTRVTARTLSKRIANSDPIYYEL